MSQAAVAIQPSSVPQLNEAENYLLQRITRLETAVGRLQDNDLTKASPMRKATIAAAVVAGFGIISIGGAAIYDKLKYGGDRQVVEGLDKPNQ